ncbi:clathrin interactor EPSIN 1-like isoform X2 [Telopea speciosissima]|uniref:clathrin interactor EPSIN 1-like isoform X2 n=1 Tax=Telopea speciosissima TaxID=54955 RepID=UPI001CC34260|nr:clathrin interactor EPSIN 1-like isoform X2 [Telopea speciosissima]
MDFMKVLDQTVREIKREVNIKVLKVPEMEQKVLDATDSEPWGPHGTALAEIAQATKKFTECQMIMNVLWTRLTETGRNWRHVYKALTVIEYLVAHGSERVLDDITEHTFQISSLSGFEYVEPNGKDMGINVRKKVENMLALLNNKDKIQEVREKAAANRDKYVGLSSSGVTYKSGSASYGSYGSSSIQYNDRYGGIGGTKDSDMFKGSYKDGDRVEDEEFHKDSHDTVRRGIASEDEVNNVKNGSARYGRNRDTLSSSTSSASSKLNHFDDKYSSPPFQSSSLTPNNLDDDFEDDFDPRGTSTQTTSGSATASVTDLFVDLMDAPTSVPTQTTSEDTNATAEVDLFADATFVSASPNATVEVGSQSQVNVDLFASQPAFPSAPASAMDFFAAPDLVFPTESKYPNAEPSQPMNSTTVDPFAAVPLNSFDGSDLFGSFTSHTGEVPTDSTQNPTSDGSVDDLNPRPSAESKHPPKKDTFQVKSGIWADSLSRGLIDLNISAPKKVSLADIGIVGTLSDGSEEKEKTPPPTAYMGRGMGMGSGLGRSSSGIGGNDMFSILSQQQQFGSFKK